MAQEVKQVDLCECRVVLEQDISPSLRPSGCRLAWLTLHQCVNVFRNGCKPLLNVNGVGVGRMGTLCSLTVLKATQAKATLTLSM